ncbi:MAG: hypothetical protein LBR78_00875 [Holosporales bacterium]|jgi:hypothetical protein|nr:hypothetical protein [Holosporales bacterium]
MQKAYTAAEAWMGVEGKQEVAPINEIHKLRSDVATLMYYQASIQMSSPAVWTALANIPAEEGATDLERTMQQHLDAARKLLEQTGDPELTEQIERMGRRMGTAEGTGRPVAGREPRAWNVAAFHAYLDEELAIGNRTAAMAVTAEEYQHSW